MTGGGAGGDALAGFEYQIDVSVWIALNLVLAARRAREIVLEPASDEDVEAPLADDEPDRVTSSTGLGGLLSS